MTDSNPHATSSRCAHCNDDVGRRPIIFAEKAFCCQGCQLVYQIIEQNGLSAYYTIEDNAGISLKTIGGMEGYDYLDESSVIDKLVTRTNESHGLITLHLPQIHCSSCIWLLERLYKLKPGIFSSRVDFMRKELEIRFDTQLLSLRSLVELLHSLGYKPTIDIHGTTAISYDRDMIIKIGVAGFSFGNIMLFSFPEYLGLEDVQFRLWFGYISILLILPSLFIGAKDYFTQALQSIYYKNFNISIPLALGMLAMFGISIFDILYNQGSGYLDSLAGLIFFLLLGKWYQHKSYNFLSFDRNYKSYFPISVTRIENGLGNNISIDKIVEGDLLLIKNNQIIPCDSILMNENANVDYSFVTGESTPIHIQAGDQLFAGGRLINKSVKVTALKKVNNSYLVSLWNNSVFDKSKSNVQSMNDLISSYFSAVIIFLAVLGFAIWINHSLEKAILTFASVLIIACPCAIAITRPFLQGNVLRLFAKHGIYIRNGAVLETSSTIHSVVFDKTGTLTIQHKNNISYVGENLTEEEKEIIFSITTQSVHPLSIGISKELDDQRAVVISDFEEISGAGLQGVCNGKRIRIGSSKFIHGMKDEGGQTRVYIQIEDRKPGYFVFKNSYRPELETVVHELKQQSKTLVVISGDNDREYSELQHVFGKDSSLYFNQSPDDKHRRIQTLQSDTKVAMIGDGLNDAVALKQSDVGIVITEEGNHFTPSCDVIIDAKSFGHISSFFKICKHTQYIVYGAYTLAAIYNIVGLSYALQGKLSPIVAAILMPASSLTIVLYTVLSSSYLLKKNLKEVNQERFKKTLRQPVQESAPFKMAQTSI